MACGLYEIQIGSYFYHGSSNNIEKRTRGHKNKLKNNKHPNPKMQSIYNKYGEFNYEVILTCKEEDLLYLEQATIDQFFEDKACMNLASIAGKPPSWQDKKHTAETKAKMSAVAVGNKNSLGYKQTEEHKAKRCLKKSEETKLKIAASQKIRWEIRNATK